MTEHSDVDRVRVLCEAAELPVSEPDLEALAPLYALISGGLDQLATVIQDGDTVPLRLALEQTSG